MSNVGQFTGDCLQSGYNLGRNSSKVLAPPGGKCSGIFGDPYQPPVSENREVAEAKRNNSTVFRSPVAQPTSYSRQIAAQRRNQSNIFGDEEPQAPQSPQRRSRTSVEEIQQEQPEQRRQPSTRYGELYGERSELGPASGKSRENVHTSSRVLAPPGGRSSNIFNL